MNRILIILTAFFLLAACEPKEEVAIQDLVGEWIVNETGDILETDTYECSVSIDWAGINSLLINNFLNLANDPDSQLRNFALSFKVEGNRIIVNPQQVGSVEIISGNGLVNDENQFKLNYNYRFSGVPYSGEALFFRK